MAEQAPTPQNEQIQEAASPGSLIIEGNQQKLVITVDRNGIPNKTEAVQSLKPVDLILNINNAQTQIEQARFALNKELSSPRKAIENTVQRMLGKEPAQITAQRKAIEGLEQVYEARKKLARNEAGIKINEWGRNPHHKWLKVGNEVNWNGINYIVWEEKKNGVYGLVPSFELTEPILNQAIQGIQKQIVVKQQSLGNTFKRVQAIWSNLTDEKPHPVIQEINALKKELHKYRIVYSRKYRSREA